ncbi:hypothetical protein [Streptomyces sp. NPDC060001]|uniref:hypothetical protein n=1 Tax=Streptomyces sp. NPDC060001 TaxID=3347032 RepID=UPI003692B30D
MNDAPRMDHQTRPIDIEHDRLMALAATQHEETVRQERERTDKIEAAALSRAVAAILTDAGLREAEEEHGLAAYGRELARLIQADGRTACPDPIECSHQAALGEARARIERLALAFEVSGNEFIAERIRSAVTGVEPVAPIAPSGPTTDRRDRYAAALRKHGTVHLGDQVPADEYDCCADGVMAVADAEQAELRARVADYENRITWHTTCASCARILDSSIQATEQTEAYRLALSEALGLGNGANWEAIRDRARDLTAEVEELTAATRRLGLTVSEYGQGASALTDKLRRARTLHRETCPLATGKAGAGFACSMCELLDEPAAPVVPPAPTSRAVLLREPEEPLSPYYEHPKCGFHWHGRNGMDIPVQDDGQPVCPRCELAKVQKQLDYTQRRRDKVGAECKRRGKIKLEQAETIARLERQLDEVRTQLGAEILRAGQAEDELLRLAAVPAAAGEQPDNETPEPEPPVVCEGFVWIGQSFATCDRCAQPAWDYDGADVAVEGAGPFDDRRTVRPWEPGEADAIRAKWAPPAVVPQPEEADRVVAHVLAVHTDLQCLACAPPPWGDIWTPVTAGELEDGGICSKCGVDVLIPTAVVQPGKEA